MANQQYLIIPGTQQRVFEGSVVMLHRLPNLRWILHNGYYDYGGRKQKGWYFSSIPADTPMPVFDEDLIAMTVIDGQYPGPPIPPGPGPVPPFPPVPPGPPAPIPIPFTPQDKKHLDSAMLTVNTIGERDRLGRPYLQDGKIVRVNDVDGQGTIEYYSWNSKTETWDEASLGYRYMTRSEIEEAISKDIVNIIWSDEEGALVLKDVSGESSQVPLTGVTHDPSYDPETITLRFPTYGKEDLVVEIPQGATIEGIRVEEHYEFPDGSIKPAIVVIVSDGSGIREIAADASSLFNNYKGGESSTATVQIEDLEGIILANVKISTLENNRLKIDRSGLYVDVSDIEERLDDLENKIDIGDGKDGVVLVTEQDGISRSHATIGGSTLPEEPGEDTVLATEAAVIKALSWQDV